MRTPFKINPRGKLVELDWADAFEYFLAPIYNYWAPNIVISHIDLLRDEPFIVTAEMGETYE